MAADSTMDELGSQLHRVVTHQWTLGKLPTLYFQPRALGLLRELKPEITLALGSPYSLTTWLLLGYGRLAGHPVALWTHGLLKDESGPKWWLRSLQFRLSSGLLLYGDRARELLKRKGIPGWRLHVIYNSLDSAGQRASYEASLTFSVEEARQRIGVFGADRVVIFVGRLQPAKKLDQIVKTVSEAKRMGKRLHAVLVGEGSEREALSVLAQQLAVSDRVQFYGPCHDEEMLGTLFRASDACLIPSGAGLTVMHSFSYATPVVTHDDPALLFPEAEAVHHGRTGFRFSLEDPNGLTKTTLLALYPRSAKEAMGEACLEEIEKRYNTSEHARRMVDALRYLLSEHRSRRGAE